MNNQLKFALAQINPTVGDLEGNFRKIQDYLQKARDLRADVVVFPELAICGYPPEDLLFREGFVRRAEEFILSLAQETKDIIAIVGYPRLREGKLYNSASVLTQQKLISVYDKHALPNYGVFDEKRYFAAGDKATIIEAKGIKLGITICEDIWEPSPVAVTVKSGAQIIVNLNASPFHIRKASERHAVIKARCEEHPVPFVYVNTVGGQDELVFDGRSMVTDKDGNILFQAPGFKESLDVVAFDGAQPQVDNKPISDVDMYADTETPF